MDHLGMIWPQRGSRSHRTIPGTRDDRTPNSRRDSAGAFGFGSHMSIWLGPPRIQRMITDVTLVPAPAWASARSNSARLSPAVPRMPAFKKLRRSTCKLRWKSAQPPSGLLMVYFPNATYQTWPRATTGRLLEDRTGIRPSVLRM